jgi:hypothetical protein
VSVILDREVSSASCMVSVLVGHGGHRVLLWKNVAAVSGQSPFSRSSIMSARLKGMSAVGEGRR